MKVSFHTSNSGRSYFEDFLKDLSIQDHAAVLATFEDIQKHGFEAPKHELELARKRLNEVLRS